MSKLMRKQEAKKQQDHFQSNSNGFPCTGLPFAQTNARNMLGFFSLSSKGWNFIYPLMDRFIQYYQAFERTWSYQFKNRDWIKKNCEKKPGNNLTAKIIYLHSTNIRQPDYTICYFYAHHFIIHIPRFKRQKASRLSTRCKILFTLELFANNFSLKSLILSLKSHTNVLCALKLTGIQVYCFI